MRFTKFGAVVAALAFAVACDRQPTGPDNLQASFDAVDPTVITFNATQGLPGGPFGQAGLPPFLGGLPFAGAPAGASDGKGPGAPLPDSVKLSDVQRQQIQALVMAFAAANVADFVTLKTALQAARAANQAGKSKADIQAILDAAKPAAERVRTAAEALRVAIANILTPLQQAWLAAHRPDHPPRTP